MKNLSRVAGNKSIASKEYVDSHGGGSIDLTGIEGILKADSDGELAAAVAGTDYVIPSAITGLAPKASPTFTGSPKAPTPASGNNSTQIATTAFVQNLISVNVGQIEALLAAL